VESAFLSFLSCLISLVPASPVPPAPSATPLALLLFFLATPYMESAGLMDWYKSRTFDGYIKPVLSSVVNFMKGEGVEKISLLGYSW
jgi:hypothetical protein